MPLDLVQGTLDMMILKALSWGDRHGYAIARWLEQTTDDDFRIEEGSLYPALHRLSRREWVRADWGVSDNNRRARYYALTPLGRRQLRHEADTWERLITAVGKVMRAQEA